MRACPLALNRYDINLHLFVRIIEFKNHVVYKVWNIMIPCIDIETKPKNSWFDIVDIACLDFAVNSVKLLWLHYTVVYLFELPNIPFRHNWHGQRPLLSQMHPGNLIDIILKRGKIHCVWWQIVCLRLAATPTYYCITVI